MKILIIGSGGREHAIAWKIAQSPKVKKIFCAPGNPGIAEVAECVDIDVNNIEGLFNFAIRQKIDLTVVGPEDPLLSGIVDTFKDGNLDIFGPSKRASLIEGSKVFAKTIMKKHSIPTADFRVFEDIKMAEKYGVSVPQLAIRYCLDLGLLPLPKTTNPKNMKNNADVDFEISANDLEILKNIEPIKNYGEASNFPVFWK